MEVLKVSSRSNPNSVAGALAGVVRQMGSVEVQVIGAGALNQAIKAVAIARGLRFEHGILAVLDGSTSALDFDGANDNVLLGTGRRRVVRPRGRPSSADWRSAAARRSAVRRPLAPAGRRSRWRCQTAGCTYRQAVSSVPQREVA